MPERLRKFEPDELDAAQRAIYDQFGSGGNRATIPGAFPLRDEAGHLNGPPNAWLLNPALGDAFQVLGFNVRSATGLPPRAQEIAILVVAQRLDSPFERFAHEPAARNNGLPEADIEALSAGRPVSFADLSEQVCYEVAVALMDHGKLTDDEYARAVGALGEKGLFGLTSIIGWYQMIALQLSVFEVLPPV